ncbi:unnamed protein product [Linum tenue]|nr:unnamed protein product [Linum tenue]
MMGNFKKKRPKLRSHDVEEEEEQIDRLSDLPDSILHSILSFLDSKSSVQTSILSRTWRCLWKAVPALNFNRRSFRKESSFRDYVEKFLSLRFRSAAVESITFDFGPELLWQRRRLELFDSVMRYVTAVQGGQLHNLSISCTDGRFSSIVASITACLRHESLKTLKLEGFLIAATALSSPGFKWLTTLELHECYLTNSRSSQRSNSVDPATNVPSCLNSLKLIDCSSKGCLVVSAPQLLDLEITCFSTYLFDGAEVFAPKLKSFRLCCSMYYLLDLHRLDFPSLDHADIRFWPEDWYSKDNPILSEDFSREYMKLLPALHNAESLNFHFGKKPEWIYSVPWEDHHFPFSRIKLLLESEASPFTRLKTLRMQYPEEPPSIPDQVLRYFFNGSSNIGLRTIIMEQKSE